MSSSPLSVSTLTAQDLVRAPIWRYLQDEEYGETCDESFALPEEAAPPREACGSFVIRATFRLHNGETLPGAVQMDQLGSKRFFTPVLLHAADKCLDPLASDIAGRLERLRQSASGPPVRWTLTITLPGDTAPASGRIPRSTALKALGALWQLAVLSLMPRGQ